MTLKKCVLLIVIELSFSIPVIFATDYKKKSTNYNKAKCDALILLKVTKEHDLETLKDQRRVLVNHATADVINHIDYAIQRKEQELIDVNKEIDNVCRDK